MGSIQYPLEEIRAMDVQVTNSGSTATSSSSSGTASHASPTEQANSVVSNMTASTTAGQNEVLQSANALLFSSVGSWIVDTNSIPPFRHFEVDVAAVQLSDAVYTSLTEAAASTIIGQVHTAQSLETIFASVGIWFTDTNVTTTVENPGVTSERQTPVPTTANTPNTASLGAFVHERSFPPPADHFDLDLEAQNPLSPLHTSLLRSIRGRYIHFHKRFEHPITIGGTVIMLVIFTLELQNKAQQVPQK